MRKIGTDSPHFTLHGLVLSCSMLASHAPGPLHGLMNVLTAFILLQQESDAEHAPVAARAQLPTSCQGPYLPVRGLSGIVRLDVTHIEI